MCVLTPPQDGEMILAASSERRPRPRTMPGAAHFCENTGGWPCVDPIARIIRSRCVIAHGQRRPRVYQRGFGLRKARQSRRRPFFERDRWLRRSRSNLCDKGRQHFSKLRVAHEYGLALAASVARVMDIIRGGKLTLARPVSTAGENEH
jgi:hypothetical protein